MTYYPIISSIKISKGYGYICGGKTTNFSVGTTTTSEKYDDVSNTWNYKANINTGRYSLCGFLLNSYGYIAAGRDIGGDGSAATEKYDDILNIWTSKTNVNTARRYLSGFSLNEYGYSSGGNIPAISAVTEKYDDVLNTWTAEANLNTARYDLAGFSINGYGYTSGGYVAAVSAVTEKYDDINNTWTAKANLNTARNALSGFSLNGYGYTSTGNTGSVNAVTEKYDDILNTWTTKASVNQSKDYVSSFSLGNLSQSIQNPDIQEIIKHSNKEMIPVDQTAARAIDGTVYTNTASSNLFITVSARCIIDTAADVANIQAFSDTAADPTTLATGKVGIEGGLLGQDISIQMVFIVRPYYKYKVVTTISAGCSATLGKWFETIMK